MGDGSSLIEDWTDGSSLIENSSVAAGGGDGDEGQQQGVSGRDEHRAIKAEPRVTEEAGAMGSNVEPVGSGIVVEDSPVVSGSSAGARATTAATSSSHRPITKYNVAEHLPDEALAKLLEDNPIIGEIVLKAKEDRARAIAAIGVAERAERERKEREGLTRDVEAEERAGAEAQGPRVTAVIEVGAVTRPDFSAEAYVPQTPHLFVPSGFAAYLPKRTEYDNELVLRDPEVHIANTWREQDRGISVALEVRVVFGAVRGLTAEGERIGGCSRFGEFIRNLTPSKNDHAVLVALAERWRDTTNTFHLPLEEMTVTPTNFATITGLRVEGEPIPFDSGIQNDRAALEWFLGDVPKIEEGMVRYKQFTRYLKRKVTTEQEEEQMARAYLLYLFGATLYPGRRSKLHLTYLPALRDLRTASCFDWGGAALGAAYGFLGDSSRTEQSTADYWRVWELWAYEVLRMYPPICKHPDLSTLPRALIWSKKNMGTKEGRGDLNAFRLYLDDLRASQINWDPWRVAGLEPEYLARSRAVTASRVLGPLPPRASHTGTYTRTELEEFTRFDTELTRYLCLEMDYATFQRDRLAGPHGVWAFRDVQSQARGAAEERRAAGERSRGGEGRVRRSLSGPMRGGSPEMSWKIPVVDTQGNPTEIHLVPARAEPPSVTVSVPNEWVNEAVRRMLAMENVIRRAASGMPLELCYPTPSPP
ncbi:hypothetical protein RHMOL_Rhmol13G0178500 [Rhododendron molle]|uniref:Uncharacterized protein n=1 Tax=Rhododendron molle TaxID=49168 RepID=A0ACC0L8Z1_RHOML|nr:hypothetical protein RHMOL_Rhmol13G0178500 [Rhododendron molle]